MNAQHSIWMWHIAKTAVMKEGFTVIGVQDHMSYPVIHMLRPTDAGWDYAVIFGNKESLSQAATGLRHQREEFQGKPVDARVLVLGYEPADSDTVKDWLEQSRLAADESMTIELVGVKPETGELIGVSPGDWAASLWKQSWNNPPRGDSVDSLRHEVQQLQRQRRSQWSQTAASKGNKKPWVTYTLLTINTVLFLLLSYFGSRGGEFSFFEGSTNIETLLQFGAKSPFHIVEGEYWRFVTPVFLHIGIMHFVFNSVALLSLGALIEHIYGRTRYLLLYLLAGVAGNVASFLLSDSIGAGASGAIFGALGAMIYVVLHRKTAWTQALGRDVLVILAINIVIGFFNPSIDNYAHFGGLIGGFLAAYALALPGQRRPALQALSALVLVGAMALGMTYGIANGENSVGYLRYASQIAIENKDYPLAIEHLERLTEEDPDDLPSQFNLAVLYTQIGNWQAAEKRWLRVTELDPENVDAWYSLGVVAYSMGDQARAVDYLKKALELDPDYAAARRLLDKIS